MFETCSTEVRLVQLFMAFLSSDVKVPKLTEAEVTTKQYHLPVQLYYMVLCLPFNIRDTSLT